ncbi:MAG: hypothetical protein M1825_001637 [Sarcosagium campestre]|nr:MAG: hypothetical protein M1825_001637 [Sarcosagium campestre]
MAAMVLGRDVVSELKSAPQTLTSWSKCMSKTYCKWPVIIGCVVGGLIALSVIFCIVRCCCCGVSCCGDCLRCCGRGSKKRTKHLDDISRPSPAYGGYRPPPGPPAYEPPRFAHFESSHGQGGKIHEDSLPAMPSWETAQSKKVMDESARHDDVELGRLDPATGQSAPMLGAASKIHGYGEDGSHQHSPQPSPYNPPGDYENFSNHNHHHAQTAYSSQGSFGHAAPAAAYAQDTGYRGAAGYGAGFQPARSPPPQSNYNNGAAAGYYNPPTRMAGAASPPSQQAMYSPVISPVAYTTPEFNQPRTQSPYRAYSPHQNGQRQPTSPQDMNAPASLIPGRKPNDQWAVI